METKQCKICNNEFTQKDLQELCDQINDKNGVESKHYTCWMITQLD